LVVEKTLTRRSSATLSHACSDRGEDLPGDVSLRKGVQALLERGQILYELFPDQLTFHGVVAVRDDIAQSDELNPAFIRHLGKCFLVNLPHPGQILADFLKSHQHRILGHRVRHEGGFVYRAVRLDSSNSSRIRAMCGA
jgi:hypothetical protein